MRLVAPGREEHGTLENEPFGVVGSSQPVEEALQRIAHQQVLEILTPLAGSVQEALTDRGREIRRPRHTTDSRYGRITRVTRQIRA